MRFSILRFRGPRRPNPNRNRKGAVTRRAIDVTAPLRSRFGGTSAATGRVVALVAVVAALLGFLPSCGQQQDESDGKRLIVLGFDGMDPRLTQEMMTAGRLPNFTRLWEEGGFCSLQTSTPPQSPVAWSSVITGLNPGGHGIFDFIHRDPAPDDDYPSPIRLYPSHADSTPDRWEIQCFGYRIPLRPGEERLLRHGKPFWEYLTEGGIPTWIYRMPANYPAQDSKGAAYYCLTDMGTPDLKQTNGMFSYYTSDPVEKRRRVSGGGNQYSIYIRKGTVQSVFHGPRNVYKADEKEQKKAVEVPFTLWRDPDEPVARIIWQDQVLMLREGEWSDWCPIEFEMIPYLASIKAECRLFLREVHPHVKLYVTPFNFDPLDKGAPVSKPDGFAAEVAAGVGRYYTQGLPEETQGLKNKVLSRSQFLDQADLVYQERMRLLDFALDNFTSGMMFFYFGSTDMIGHMFWGARTVDHPALTSEEQEQYAHEMERVYEDADRALGKVLDRFGEATVIVLSDHGFETFTRGFNLNAWLLKYGYLSRKYDQAYDMPLNIDFERSRAYGLCINGLYVNLKGRERTGIVDPADKQALLDEITEGLLAEVDPKTGQHPIKEVYQSDRVYSGPYVYLAPDLQIGYNRGYRVSWGTVLGGVPQKILENNTDAWCADHCIATDLVPGILLSNRKIREGEHSLIDIAPTILAKFGLPIPETMEGSSVLVPPDRPKTDQGAR